VTNNQYGIRLAFGSTSSNTIKGNLATKNQYGIYLDTSNDNTITDNTVQYNTADGLYLTNSNNNNIQRNTITDNTGYGVNLLSSSNLNTIAYNDLTVNPSGSWHEDATSINNNIHDNT